MRAGVTTREKSVRGVVHAVLSDQRFRFLLVGGFNVVQGVGWFALLHLAFGDLAPYLVLLALAYVPAILIGFTLYRVLVFDVRGHLVKDFVRFTMVQGAAFALNSVTLPFFHEILRLHLVIGQALSVGVIVVFNYVGHFYFSFRRSHHHAGPEDLPASTPRIQ